MAETPRLKKVTFFGTLMRLAREEAQARLHGTEEEFQKAKERHESYRKQCLEADEMVLGVSLHDS